MKPEEIVKNFRDLGFSINTIAKSKLFPEGRIYRGGRLNNLFSHSEILNIPTIINIRTGKDEKQFDCNYIHCPADDKLENYETGNRKIRKWVNDVLQHLCDLSIEYPVLIHCTSGKDRTGVICAAICLAYGISENYIIEDYLQSEGNVDVRLIKSAIKGFGDIETYLNKVNIKQLRENIRGKR